MRQDFMPRMMIMLGTSNATSELVAAVKQRIDAVPGGRDRASVITLDAHLARTALAAERIAASLVTTSAVMAIGLAVLGVYGALAESARYRRREMALRIALGAHGWRLVRQVLGDGMRLATAGALTGMAASALGAIWLRRIVPSAGAGAAWMWAVTPIVLFALVGVATIVPARRALSVDPLAIMRDAP
jgi:ABC-type antimicrobial peptide transport system permease subunit